jgi:hypothetical protein
MSDEIKPALTPEEWAGPYPIERHDWTAQVKRRGDGTHRLYLEVEWSPIDERASLHALAALALHGQPFGFTWEMHDALYRQAQHRMGDTMQDTQDRARLLGVCRRIAALLPPREE